MVNTYFLIEYPKIMMNDRNDGSAQVCLVWLKSTSYGYTNHLNLVWFWPKVIYRLRLCEYISHRPNIKNILRVHLFDPLNLHGIGQSFKVCLSRSFKVDFDSTRTPGGCVQSTWYSRKWSAASSVGMISLQMSHLKTLASPSKWACLPSASSSELAEEADNSLLISCSEVDVEPPPPWENSKRGHFFVLSEKRIEYRFVP